MENTSENYRNIKGWGIDADPENEPTYPMKNYTGDDHYRLKWERPDLQVANEEILISNERPYNTAVFGTTVPPSGLSGIIRRKAFKYSEGSFRHWLPLILADRVNAVEGIIDDLGKGIIPNIFAEFGWKAEWKHRPVRLVAKVTLTVAVLGTAAALIYNSNKRKTTDK